MFRNRTIEIFENYDSFIIVGNSPVLLENHYGSFIDSHDCIIRMNAAEVESYEKYVGSGTDYRIINSVLQKGKSLSASETPKGWIETLKGENVILKPFDYSSEYKAKNLISGTCNVLSMSQRYRKYFDGVRERLNLNSLSTGLFSIFLFLYINGKVNITGFDFYNSNYSSFHYWEDFNSKKVITHAFSKEKKIIRKLESFGKLKLIQ